jgi:hypothetical protein
MNWLRRLLPRRPGTATPPSGSPASPPPPSAATALAAVRQAAAGLRYPSESDEPVEPFQWPAATGESAAAAVAAHEPPGTPLDEKAAAGFFAELEGTDAAAGFGRLRLALEAAVTGLTVIRAGEVRVAVYVVGRLGGPGGDWAGVRTVSVET